MTKYYKFLDGTNHSEYAGFDFTPFLPHDGEPGEWTPAAEGELVMCENGWHVTDVAHLIEWRNDQLFECEVLDPVAGGNKTVCRSIRLTRKVEAWNDKTLRLFACWCVRQVWHLLTDERSRNAVEVAERYANGEATSDERDAARAAAYDAAWYAARDAAWYAAYDAARDAARDAAWYAASNAARAAARAAARDAAWAAARAAARDAAWAAARAAARDAARDAQNAKLAEMMGLEE